MRISTLKTNPDNYFVEQRLIESPCYFFVCLYKKHNPLLRVVAKVKNERKRAKFNSIEDTYIYRYYID